MSDEHLQTGALQAIDSALKYASDDLFQILNEEAEGAAAGGPLGKVTTGVRLAYALGQLTQDQREAFLAGASLSEQKHRFLSKLLDYARSDPQ